MHGFTLKLKDECSLNALRDSNLNYLAGPENQILSLSSCDVDVLLDGQDVDILCQNAIDINGKIIFDEIVQQEKDSNTYWNKEVETNYDLDGPNGLATNVLKKTQLKLRCKK